MDALYIIMLEYFANTKIIFGTILIILPLCQVTYKGVYFDHDWELENFNQQRGVI